jgi:type IV secretory pathway TrbD component
MGRAREIATGYCGVHEGTIGNPRMAETLDPPDSGLDGAPRHVPLIWGVARMVLAFLLFVILPQPHNAILYWLKEIICGAIFIMGVDDLRIGIFAPSELIATAVGSNDEAGRDAALRKLTFRSFWLDLLVAVASLVPLFGFVLALKLAAPFWGLAASAGLTLWFVGHQSSNLVMSQADPRVRLPPYIAITYAIYSWLWYAWLVAVIWFGFRVGWLAGAECFVAALIINLALKVFERTAGLHRRAWMIADVGVPLVPVFIVAMFFFVLQAQ